MNRSLLYDFLVESNTIEGITQHPTTAQVDSAEKLLACKVLRINDVLTAQSVIAPGRGLRYQAGMNVTVGAHGCDWSTKLQPAVVKAYNLPDALRLAAELPLAAWFPDEDTDREAG